MKTNNQTSTDVGMTGINQEHNNKKHNHTVTINTKADDDNNNNNATSTTVHHTSTFEYFWARATRSIILPTDNYDEMCRKVCCLTLGSAFPAGFFGIYLIIAANDQFETGSDEWVALFLAGMACAVCCIGTFLPIMIYVAVKKEAPPFLANFICWALLLLCIFADICVTFLPVGLLLLTVTAVAITSGLPSGNIIGFLSFSYLVFIVAMREFEFSTLRIPGAYEGRPVERFLFTFAAILNSAALVFIGNAARWEQLKALRVAETNVKTAREVANHILNYDTDKVKETLDTAVKDVVIDEELDWVEPSRVSKPLIGAFREINQNLEQWKPLLPDWAIARRAMRDSRGDSTEGANEDDEDEDEHNRRLSIYATSASGTKDSGVDQLPNRYSNTQDSEGEVIPIVDTEKNNLKMNDSGKNKPQYMQHDKRSWEHGSDGNSSGLTDENSNKSATANPSAAGSMLLKGSFVERVIVCRLNLAQIPQFLISSLQLSNRSSKKLLAQTSARFNKIVELLLETATTNSATIHAIYSDCVYISWNATTRVASSDGKALKFLTSFEHQLRTELTKIVVEVDRENESHTSKLQQHGQYHLANNNKNDHTTNINLSDRSGNSIDGEAMNSKEIRVSTDAVDPQSTFASSTKTQNNNRLSLLSGGGADGEPPCKLLSGAALHGSCFTQVAGNMKRQQFVLSSFSNQDAFEQACALGDRGGFIAVSKRFFSNFSNEYEFRGCGLTVPKKHEGLFNQVLHGLGGGGDDPGSHHPNDENSNTQPRFKRRTSVADEEQAHEVADGNLCNINVPSPSTAGGTNDPGALSSGGFKNIIRTNTNKQLLHSMNSLYELVGPKLSGGAKGDNADGWMYKDVTSADELDPQNRESVNAFISVTSNEIVQLLTRGDVAAAETLLTKVQHSTQTSSFSLPSSFDILKRSVSLVKKLRHIGEEESNTHNH